MNKVFHYAVRYVQIGMGTTVVSGLTNLTLSTTKEDQHKFMRENPKIYGLLLAEKSIKCGAAWPVFYAASLHPQYQYKALTTDFDIPI